MGYDSQGSKHSVHALWNRRHSTKFNGVSYPVQVGAAAVYSDEGRDQVKSLTDYYLANAAIIRERMTGLGYTCVGGDHSPYIWVRTGTDSWAFFDRLLAEAGVVTTPGTGFGRCGEGYIRISAFNHREKVEEGITRIARALG
jgi:LL-diaminopimelate aminotransferase